MVHLVQNELLDDAGAGLDGVAQVEEDESGLDGPTAEEPPDGRSALTLHGGGVNSIDFSASSFREYQILQTS